MGFPLILKIDVTQDDIDNGIRGSSSACAVSRAVKRLYPGQYVSTNQDEVRVGDVVYVGNASLEEVVKSYDAHEELTPRTLYLSRDDDPDESDEDNW